MDGLGDGGVAGDYEVSVAFASWWNELGADAGIAELQVGFLYFRQKRFCTLHKIRDGQAIALVVILRIDISCRWSQEDRSPQSFCEVHAEAEGVGVGERVDEIVDERAARAANFAVFAADGINFPGDVAEEGCDFVGVEAGGIDNAASFDGFVLRVFRVADAQADTDGSGASFERNHFCALDDVRALVGGETSVGAHEVFGGDNAGGRNVERGDTGDVRLAGANFVGPDEAKAFDTVLLAILF